MGFKDRKRDDHGHVIGSDEVDGQECQHVSGQADKVEDQKYNKEMQAAQNQNADMREAFDDDYEEEFNEPSPEDEKQYVDKCMEDIAKASNKKAFEYVSGNIDDLTEAGLISEETSDRLYAELDKKIDEVNNDIDKDLMYAINMADDDVLDEQFGKDTPERKLTGAMKEQPMSKKDDEIVQKINAMKDEFYGIEPDEAERIVKDLDDKFEREEKVNNNAKKFLDLMKNNKKDEAWNFLKTLSNEDVSYIFEKIRRDKK